VWADNPSRIARISLPQTFELVGRDSSGNAVVKYGFVLKQWFVGRGSEYSTYSRMKYWCNKIGGYRIPYVKDLTNAICTEEPSIYRCQGAVGATPSSSGNNYMRHIGAGLFAEWGRMDYYAGSNFDDWIYDFWANGNLSGFYFYVDYFTGIISSATNSEYELPVVCVYP